MTFDLAEFLKLSGEQLRNYSERLLAGDSQISNVEVVEASIELFSQLTPEHKVFLLDLLDVSAWPERVSLLAAIALSDSDASVCAAAFRVFERLEIGSVGSKAAEVIRTVAPIKLYATDVRSGLASYVGTNERFISEVRRKFVDQTR